MEDETGQEPKSPQDARLDSLEERLERLQQALGESARVDEGDARRLVESLALALQAGALLRAGNPLALPFCASRIGARRGRVLGTLERGAWIETALERAFPIA